MRRHFPNLVFILALTTVASVYAQSSSVLVTFDNSAYTFSKEEKAHIEKIARQSEMEVRQLLPDLTQQIHISISAFDRDLTDVGGITGHAQDPNNIALYISTSFPGGVTAASNTGLAPVLHHEFHHLVRGWTIEDNKFGPGIAIAAINEGLANVFSETYTRTAFAGNASPINANEWWQEILELPANANYGHWMVQHPDGRRAIGYRAGSYVVREALAASKFSILELSELSVEEIVELAGRKP